MSSAHVRRILECFDSLRCRAARRAPRLSGTCETSGTAAPEPAAFETPIGAFSRRGLFLTPTGGVGGVTGARRFHAGEDWVESLDANGGRGPPGVPGRGRLQMYFQLASKALRNSSERLASPTASALKPSCPAAG